MKIIFIILSLFLGLHSYASDFPYMTFETTDGGKASVVSNGLQLSFSGNVLTVGEKSFAISNLSKMYFSTNDETTGIKTISVSDMTEGMEIYDLRGNRVRKEQMQSGIYLIKDKKATYKIAVK